VQLALGQPGADPEEEREVGRGAEREELPQPATVDDEREGGGEQRGREGGIGGLASGSLARVKRLGSKHRAASPRRVP
jgi:hypothetical protein